MLILVYADNIEPDVVVQIRFMDVVIGRPDNQLTLFVVYKFLRITKPRPTAVFDLDKNQ